jgi:hypothetical protein
MVEWIIHTPIWVLGLLLFTAMLIALWVGSRIDAWQKRHKGGGSGLSDTQEGYVVTSIYTLVGLLIAFTFGMAIDRFDARRALVVEDANAIETLYLRAQLLPEPHRDRFSKLLVRYAENHVALAKDHHADPTANRLTADNRALLTELWTITVPAFNSIRTIDFSSSFVDSVNEVIRIDVQRKALRRAQIPAAVIGLLMFYSLIAAAVLGYVMAGAGGELTSAALLGLFVLAFMLLSDINRPVTGTIHESQEPMELMLARLKANPPSVYNRLETDQTAVPAIR